MSQRNHSVTNPSPRTLRLTFAYDGNDVRLIRSQPVAMITPPSVTPPPQEDQSGHWFEVHDAEGNILYHRALHDPLRADIEVFSDDPAESLTRVPNPNPRGEFTLLVPDLPDAHTFVFRGTPPAAEARFAAATELLRYSFDELHQLGSGHPRPPEHGTTDDEEAT